MRDPRKSILPFAWLALLLALTVPSAGCRGAEPKVGREVDDTTSQAEVAQDSAEEPTADVEDTEEVEDVEVDIEDASTTAKVKTKLVGDERVSAFDVNVSTRDGIVTLKGSVDEKAAKQAAEEIARGTEGVSDVVNMITIGGGESSAT
ncbi:MAG TPA: BON domain-containing protein [Thermoanaerobaculia bacterium]